MTDEELGREIRRLSDELAAIRARRDAISALEVALQSEDRLLGERSWTLRKALRQLTEGGPDVDQRTLKIASAISGAISGLVAGQAR